MTNDLYDNTDTPFKDWSKDVQNEFFQATTMRGEPWDFRGRITNAGRWLGTQTRSPCIDLDGIYRLVRPKPIPDSIDWSVFTDDVVFMARDGDGKVYAYTSLPEKVYDYWVPKRGSEVKVNNLSSYKRGTLPWDQSLVWRPGYEPKEEG